MKDTELSDYRAPTRPEVSPRPETRDMAIIIRHAYPQLLPAVSTALDPSCNYILHACGGQSKCIGDIAHQTM